MQSSGPTNDIQHVPPTPRWRGQGSWLDDRLDLRALYRKYGRKVFPVHSTFFLGEMALFAFIIIVLTGTYLGFIYVPSSTEVTVGEDSVPEAYASVQLIESIPVANLFRNTHHWAAHVMIASILLHLLRVFFTGTYRRPREVNWVIGVVLLGLSLMAGFVGYALPYDSYAVTATGIGYSIARSIPWIGEFASELFFGGAFPTLGSLARLYTLHVFVLPAILTGVMALHLLIVVKQKHTQPGYARRQAEPGKVLGVPLMPYQALLAVQLLLLMFGALFLLSAFVPPHPLEAFGPPAVGTPEVKPDWYLLWIYGFLKILPSGASFDLFGARFGADFFGGLLFPALIFGIMTLAPWMDRTNRRATQRFEYLEPVRQSPLRTTLGVALLAFIGALNLAAYYDDLGMTLFGIWFVVLVTPAIAGAFTFAVIATRPRARNFDPRATGEPASFTPEPVLQQEPSSEPPISAPAAGARASAPPDSPAGEPVEERVSAPGDDDDYAESAWLRGRLARGDLARDNVVAILHEMGELAPLVRQLDDDEELLEVIEYIESLRATLADSNTSLRGAVRAERSREER